MYRFVKRTFSGCAIAFTVASLTMAQGKEPPPAPDPALAGEGTYTTLSGTILQLNFDRDANVEGFLLNDHVMVYFPPRAAPWTAESLHPGDTVQVTGLQQTLPSGFQRMEMQRLQDKTSGKSVTVPQAGAPAPYSGTARVKQLNYAADGAVNGFLLDNGTLAEVPPFAATNPTSIRIGSTLRFSGYARNSMSGHAIVEVQTLSADGQQLALNMAPPRGEASAPRRSPRGATGGRVVPSTPVAPGGIRAVPAPPAPPDPDRAQEPPAPPSPPQE